MDAARQQAHAAQAEQGNEALHGQLLAVKKHCTGVQHDVR
jgi:hypothetical protein